MQYIQRNKMNDLNKNLEHSNDLKDSLADKYARLAFKHFYFIIFFFFLFFS